LPGFPVRKDRKMTLYQQARGWFVPPVLVPLMLGLLVVAVAVIQ